MARIDSSRNFDGTVGTDDVTAFDANDQGLLDFSNARDANSNGTDQLSQKYEQILAEIFARYPGSQQEYEAKLSTWRQGDPDPLKYVLSSKDEDPANNITGWDYYNSRLTIETEALRGQNRVTLKDNLQQHIKLLDADLASSYGPLIQNPNNAREIQRIKNEANSADNEANPVTAEEIRVHATEAAKKLIFESGSRGEELRDKNREASLEFNALVDAKLRFTDPNLTGAQKNAFDAKQRDAARNMQDLWNELINQGLQECQALIIIKMEALEWASPGAQSNHPEVWLPQNFAAGELTEFDKILLEANNPNNHAARDQLASIIHEREDLISILRGSYISSMDDLGIVLGAPQNNQNNQNQQQNQNALNNYNQAQADFDTKLGNIKPGNDKVTAHGEATNEWSERQAGRGRISTLSFMRKNTKNKLEKARDGWKLTASELITSLETNFNSQRTSLTASLTALYDARHNLDPVQNPNEYLDDNAYNAKIADIDNELNRQRDQIIENQRRALMTHATTRTQELINENTAGKNPLTRKFLKIWGVLSGGSGADKGLGKFFRENKIGRLSGKLIKAGMISLAALPVGIGASLLFSGVGAGVGAVLGAGLLARGVARGIAGAKMQTATQGETTDATRRKEEIENLITTGQFNNLDDFGETTHKEVNRRLRENQKRMTKSAILGGALGLALGTFGHYGMSLFGGHLPHINMPWSHSPSPNQPVLGKVTPPSNLTNPWGTGSGGNAGVGNYTSPGSGGNAGVGGYVGPHGGGNHFATLTETVNPGDGQIVLAQNTVNNLHLLPGKNISTLQAQQMWEAANTHFGANNVMKMQNLIGHNNDFYEIANGIANNNGFVDTGTVKMAGKLVKFYADYAGRHF